MIGKNTLRLVAIIMLAFVAGCSQQKSLTVSDVIQNARALDGQTIRVHGQVFLWTEPSREEMWLSGGCVPITDASHSSPGTVVGRLTLYDSIDPEDLRQYGAPHDKTSLTIPESAFHCNGDYCKITCSPFEVVSERAYQFVGTLRVTEEAGLFLENIVLEQSSQFVDGSWIPLQKGNFDVMFP